MIKLRKKICVAPRKNKCLTRHTEVVVCAAKPWFTTWRKRLGLKGPGAFLVDSTAFRSSPSSAFKYAGGIRHCLQSKLDRTASRLVIGKCALNCEFLPSRVKFEARARRVPRRRIFHFSTWGRLGLTLSMENSYTSMGAVHLKIFRGTYL